VSEAGVLDAAPAELPAHVELAALTMLASRVKQRTDQLRTEVGSGWAAGSRQVLTLPNLDVPADPYEVAEVRCDRGSVSAVVSDPDAFLDWVRENAPGEVIEQPAKCLAPDTPPGPLAALLVEVFGRAQTRCTGPFAEPVADVIWSLLLEAGWTLVPVQHRPAETFVREGYAAAVLQLSEQAKEACAPQGLIPAGVTVTLGDPRVYVKVTKDAALQDGFAGQLRWRALVHRLMGEG
jgi:hypothetical protein